MRILPIINNRNVQNFSGERILQKAQTKFYEPNAGCLDDLTRSAPPKCIFYSYVYHPFKGESLSSIENVLSEGNYSCHCKYDENSDTLFYESSTTKLGKTLPYREDEWQELSLSERENNIKLVEED